MDDPTAPAPLSNTAADRPAPRPRKRGRWLKFGLFSLFSLGLLAWFAPAIVAITVLNQGVPQSFMPMFQGKITFSGVSLGWLSPIVIRDLKVADQDGDSLLEARQISSSNSLLQLATNLSSLGTFKIVDPVVHVVLRNDGSNLEDQVAGFSSGTSTGQSTSPDVTVEIENATIHLEHQETRRKSSFEQIALRAVTTQGNVDEVDLAIGIPAASLTKPAPHESEVKDWLIAHYGPVKGSPEETTAPSTAKTAILRASQWKLDRLSAGLARLLPGAELAGELDAETSVTLTPNAHGFDWDWNGEVSIEKLLVAGIAALQQDRLALEQLKLTGRAATTQGRLAMNNLKLVADVGELSATGDIPLDGVLDKPAFELVQSLLSDEDYHLAGTLNLKKLASMLPQTLRIRDDIEITAGEVQVELVGADSQGSRHWSGGAGVVGLAAIHQGQPIAWNKPLITRVTAHREQQSIVIDLAECRSDFLQIKGSGTLEAARFTASGDLTKLLENLEQFVDLGIEQLSGELTASGELKRTDNDHVSLQSQILLDNFAYVVSKDQVWQEKHLELSLVAEGLADAQAGLTRIEQGVMKLISGNDTLNAQLTQPIDLSSKTPLYAGQVAVKGDLASWQNRLRPFVAVNDWKLAGELNLETAATASTQQIDVGRFSLALRGLEADGPGWIVQERELKLDTSGVWEMNAQKWTSPKTSVTGTALSAQVTDVECMLGPQGLARLVGTAEYRADLKQISHWRNLAAEKPEYYLIGSLSGQAKMTQQGPTITGTIDSQVDKLVVAGLSTPPNGQPTWVALWKEPQLKLSARAAYDTAADDLALDSSSLQVDGVTLSATGKLDDCLTRQQIDLAGTLDYDWARLVQRFGDQLGKNIQLTGQDQRPFTIKGSLASLSGSPSQTSPGKTPASTVSFRPDSHRKSQAAPSTLSGLTEMTATAGIGWSTANVYGLVAGPGDVSMKLEQGICQFAPLDITVNEGKLHLTPAVHLESDPYLLVLPREKVIDQILLSPELCRGWLKYVVPTLADSAQVEGKLSLDLAGASLPLNNPVIGDLEGTLSVHQVQVRPGPLALQIVGAIDQIQALLLKRQAGELSKEQVWLQMPEQQIPFKMAQGRVYHEGMTFTVKNVQVKTSGSVGIDESLQLVAEIPVRDEWLGSNKVFAGLKGQTVQIPINGSLTRPQLDPRVLTNLSRQIGTSAVEGLIQDQVGDKLDGAVKNGLDKLFRKK